MEKEVIALEKTLQALSSRNETFRLKISGNEIQCEDVEKKANLENVPSFIVNILVKPT